MGKSAAQQWKEETGDFLYASAFQLMEEAWTKKEPFNKLWAEFSSNAGDDFFAAFFGTHEEDYYENKMMPQVRLQFNEKTAQWTDGLDLTQKEKKIVYTYSDYKTAEDFIKSIHKFVRAYFNSVTIKVEIKRNV